jgi:hypothetical protein
MTACHSHIYMLLDTLIEVIGATISHFPGQLSYSSSSFSEIDLEIEDVARCQLPGRPYLPAPDCEAAQSPDGSVSR